MALQVQIHGGPRDGEYVPYAGPMLRLPRPAGYRYVPEGAALPGSRTYYVDEYEVQRGFDGELYYVRRTGVPGA